VSAPYLGTLPSGTARRLRIVHRTGYRYSRPIGASYNEARMTPLTTPTQTVLEARLEVTPVTWSTQYWDYWGSQVSAFEVLTPHRELTVISNSTVETSAVPRPDHGADWDHLRSAEVRGANLEWLVQSARTEPVAEVAALADEAAGGLPPEQAARAVCERLREIVDYRPGVTGVHSGAAEVWAARSGVCQDFAHLAIGALRHLGIPARYVSGYLHPYADADVGDTVEGESHAWIEYWSGQWRPYDPTSVREAGVDHVVVARGRDYADVPPLKGVFAGPADSTLFVAVEVTRLV